MPTPLSPSSSQEIVPVSPPLASSSTSHFLKRHHSTTLPSAIPFDPPADLKPKIHAAMRAQRAREEGQSGKRKAREGEVEDERKRVQGMARSRVTERMMKTMGKGVNPITNSDLYSRHVRSDHFVSAATGHQQSNRGGGSSGAATYWEVRTAKMAEQARTSKTEVLKGCVFYINGSTGPRVSNLQLQNMITSNGGRFTPTQNSMCTHIVASGGLSGTKTQKFINGQGGRGASRRAMVVRVEWVLDCVERRMRVSEAGYGVIADPSQVTLFKALGVKPKLNAEAKADREAEMRAEVTVTNGSGPA